MCVTGPGGLSAVGLRPFVSSFTLGNRGKVVLFDGIRRMPMTARYFSGLACCLLLSFRAVPPFASARARDDDEVKFAAGGKVVIYQNGAIKVETRPVPFNGGKAKPVNHLPMNGISFGSNIVRTA